MDEPDRQIHTETQLSSYEGYVPDDWGAEILVRVPRGSVIEQLLLDLALSWRTTSYTAQMPATAIRAMHAAALGRSNFVSPDSSIVSFSDRIIGRLAQRVPELVTNRALGDRLVESLAGIATEFRDRAAAVRNDFPIEPIWAEFLTQAPFRLSLWASQRVAFVAFYNAYEAFLVDCAKRALDVTQLRATDKAFLDALRSAFGRDLTGACWTHHEIHIAREARHSLSHAGGRETIKLKKQKHGIRLIDGVLQIVPNDIHKMLGRLRSAVRELVTAATSSPRFIAPAAGAAQPPEDGG